jgi:hypothetical protein
LTENEEKIRMKRESKTTGNEIRQFMLSNGCEKNTMSAVGGPRLFFRTKPLMLGNLELRHYLSLHLK